MYCPLCNSGAYIGLITIECENRSCINYVSNKHNPTPIKYGEHLKNIQERDDKSNARCQHDDDDDIPF